MLELVVGKVRVGSWRQDWRLGNLGGRVELNDLEVV
jgi:hypothetical protein